MKILTENDLSTYNEIREKLDDILELIESVNKDEKQEYINYIQKRLQNLNENKH